MTTVWGGSHLHSWISGVESPTLSAQTKRPQGSDPAGPCYFLRPVQGRPLRVIRMRRH